LCSRCFSITEDDPCDVCDDQRRDGTMICVVAEAKDVFAIERTSAYHGRYHVLGGLISPMWSFLVGPKRAKQMSFVAGSQVSGATSADWGWANYSVPEAELWDNVAALAGQIAKVPLPTLRMKKASINRVAEIQGFRSAMSMGAETDALLHFSPEVIELHELIKSKGLKGAIAEFNGSEAS